MSVLSPDVCTDYMYLVNMTEWPQVRKELLTRLTMYSLFNMSTCICNFTTPRHRFAFQWSDNVKMYKLTNFDQTIWFKS